MDKILNILHIEDNAIDGILIKERILSEMKNVEFTLVASEKKVSDELENKKYNLVLCDYAIPGFGGERALEIVRSKFADIPFIFVSGTIGEERAIELLKNGATDYIIKQNLNRLLPAIRRALNETEILKQKYIAEKELIESRHFIQRIVDTSPNIIHVFDLNEKRNVFINKQIEDILGYSPAEIQNMGGSLIEKLIHPDDLEAAIKANGYYNINPEGVLEKEFRMKHKNGNYVWILSHETIFTRTEDGTPKQIIGTAQDITLKKIAEQELIEAKEKAESSDRMKSDFLAQMSHEIRTPLGAILSYTDILKMEYEKKLDEDIQMIFHGIDSSGKRLIRTIDLILNMSSIQTQSYQPNFSKINISDLLKRLMNEFYSLSAASGLNLEFEEPEIDNEITGDEYTIYQIFQNLIDNAIKYTKKGSIRIKAYRNEQDKMCVDVADTGIGISEEYMKNLFKPFTQESIGYSRKFEGNGLGLALVKNYIEINEAEISVKSIKDEGTTFTVLFKS